MESLSSIRFNPELYVTRTKRMLVFQGLVSVVAIIDGTVCRIIDGKGCVVERAYRERENGGVSRFPISL